MSPKFFHDPHDFASMGGSHASQEETEPDIETVPETQPEPIAKTSQRGKRSHKKNTRMLHAGIEPTQSCKLSNSTPFFGIKFTKLFLLRGVKVIIGTKIRYQSTDINQKCHQFQEVFQRTKDNWGGGQNGANILTRALEEYNQTRGVFTYLNCWKFLCGSPKWSNVPSMMTTGRRKAKRSKTSSLVDPETPTFDARDVELKINLDDEDEEVELARPPSRRSGKKRGKAESSSANFEIKQDSEKMNRPLQDKQDLGHRRLETMQERNSENKKFVALQESRQMEKDIETFSKPADHFVGDALILAEMHRQQIRDKYGL